jgi:hypothetical protein
MSGVLPQQSHELVIFYFLIDKMTKKEGHQICMT